MGAASTTTQLEANRLSLVSAK